jgi:hypothetical protein
MTSRPRVPRPLATFSAALALFLTVLTVLAWQVGSGNDPAIGSGQAAAVAQTPKRVLVKRLVRRVVHTKVVVVPPEEDDAPAAAGTSYAVAPVVRSAPAPVVSAAAPAPAPAPAPAVTQTS